MGEGARRRVRERDKRPARPVAPYLVALTYELRARLALSTMRGTMAKLDEIATRFSAVEEAEIPVRLWVRLHRLEAGVQELQGDGDDADDDGWPD